MNCKTLILNNTKTSAEFEKWLEQRFPDASKKINIVLVQLEHFYVEELQQLLSKANTNSSILILGPQLQEADKREKLEQTVNNTNSYKQFIYLPFQNKVQKIPVQKIMRLQAISNYTKFYIRGFNDAFITSKTLKHYEQKLNPKQFIRPNRSHLVNINFISNISLKTSKFLTLKDKTIVKISRRRFANVKAQLKSKLMLNSNIKVTSIP